jgi:hypothetical protein
VEIRIKFVRARIRHCSTPSTSLSLSRIHTPHTVYRAPTPPSARTPQHRAIPRRSNSHRAQTHRRQQVIPDISLPQGVHLTLAVPKGAEHILSTEALEFLAILHRTFEKTRQDLLANRKKVQEELDAVSLFSMEVERVRGANMGAECLVGEVVWQSRAPGGGGHDTSGASKGADFGGSRCALCPALTCVPQAAIRVTCGSLRLGQSARPAIPN